jgi:hypothetical protein
MSEWPEAAMRGWCEGLARTLQVQRIEPRGQPYLNRYFLAGWNPWTKRPGSTVYLHHFVASDPQDEVHSHPWAWGASLILVGGYREYRCDAAGSHMREYRPGETNVVGTQDQHRVELLEADCWTLFLVGAYAQPWGFSKAC